MKILAINSSFRGNNGYTKFLIDKLFEGASQEGATCENINLADFEINHCIDCQVCQTEKHYLKCIHKDDAEMILNKIKNVDLLIFATPIYVFNISSLLKTLIERLYSTCEMNCFKITKSGLPFHNTDINITSKPFVYLITCDNALKETTRSAELYFETYAKFMDAKIVGTLVRRTGALVGHGKDHEKEKKFPIINNIYKSYFQAGRELAMFGKIKASTQRRTNKAIVNVPYLFKYLSKFDFVKKKAENLRKSSMESAIKR